MAAPKISAGPPKAPSTVGAAQEPSGRVDATTAIPNDPAFVGVRLALQAVGFGRSGALGLGNAIELVVQP